MGRKLEFNLEHYPHEEQVPASRRQHGRCQTSPVRHSLRTHCRRAVALVGPQGDRAVSTLKSQCRPKRRRCVRCIVNQPATFASAVPTMGEALGVMRDDDLVAWYGLLVPAKTPADVVQALEKAAFAVLRRAGHSCQARCARHRLGRDAGKPFTERMRPESRRYAETIRRFSLKAG